MFYYCLIYKKTYALILSLKSCLCNHVNYEYVFNGLISKTAKVDIFLMNN